MSQSIRDSLDHCVKCTICETQCPVAAVTPLFPGPKYVGPQAERYRDAAREAGGLYQFNFAPHEQYWGKTNDVNRD